MIVFVLLSPVHSLKEIDLQAEFGKLLYEEPAVTACSGCSVFGRQLRHLVLRNLGDLLAESDATAEGALRMYVEALDIDPEDIVLWHRAGTLVSKRTTGTQRDQISPWAFKS